VGPEFRVNTNTSSRQNKPAISADSAGNFVVVWRSSTSQGDYIQGRRFSGVGVPLGPEFRVNTFLLTLQSGLDKPSVATDGVGDFLVVWPQQDVFDEGVFARLYAGTGIPVGNEFRVNSYTTSTQAAPMPPATSWWSGRPGSRTRIIGTSSASATVRSSP
jgi:hypothetical protein